MKSAPLLVALLAVTLASLAHFGGTVDAAKKAVPQPLTFRAQFLHRDNNEGCAVGDLNLDGHPDITAGEHWYEGPSFEKQRRLRKLLPFGKDYLQNNGEHLYDVNGDGWLDVVSGEFTTSRVHWFENPGDHLATTGLWKTHLLRDTETTSNEMTFLFDIDGDGNLEYLENSWNERNPMTLWRFVRDPNGQPTLQPHIVSQEGNGHGMGFGDLNGDGRTDIVFKNGWYACPEAGPYSGPWTYHPDFTLPHASCPILVKDLNGDGRQDLIWADGHNYGLYWEEQQAPSADGRTHWRQHQIDKRFAQGHALAWSDLDNDGAPELISGKRYYAHSGNDPGAEDPVVVQYYDYDPHTLTFKKHLISQGTPGEGPGIGLQIRVDDLDDDGWRDLVVSGKSGTYVLWNEGR